MKEAMVFGDTLPQAYHSALWMLENNGDICDCSDWNTTQKEISLTMVVNQPMSEPRISKLFIGGPRELEQYRQEIIDGILDFEIEKGNWNYTYHDRMTNYPIWYVDVEEQEVRGSLNQIEFVVSELKRNPSSRRAVIQVRDPSVDAFSNDPACLQHIQYFIREGKLDCKVLFRSNDACKAAFMNAFALICLQETIAEKLGVPVGKYTHRANSFHCYAQDFELLKGYVSRITPHMHRSKVDDCDDLCYSYDGDWKEEMEDSKEAIQSQVNTLQWKTPED